MKYNRIDKIIQDYIENPEYFFEPKLYEGLLELINEENIQDDQLRQVLAKFKPVTPDYIGLICLFYPYYGSFMMHQVLGNGWKLFIYRILLLILTGLTWGIMLSQIIVGDIVTLDFFLCLFIFLYSSWFFRKQSRTYNVVILYANLREKIKKETT